MPNEPHDIVVEARAKLAKPNYGMGKRNRELMTQLCDEVERLRGGIRKTLDENGHLADGDNCTLIYLKRAIGER